MPKADINFEKELWDAANELRGAVSENNYKNYILPLVFLKHLSERHDVVKEELQAQLNDPKSDRYTIDTDEINYVLEDADEYRAKNAFVIPEKARIEHLPQYIAHLEKRLISLAKQKEKAERLLAEARKELEQRGFN
jgi:type I restriction enzyme M protein